MVLERASRTLVEQKVNLPAPGPTELLVRVRCTGVCRTDLHILDGELLAPRLPLIMGHQIVGTVVEQGGLVEGFAEGQRVGVPWLGWACGDCRACQSGRENLCERAEFTGYQRDGGYADYAVVSPHFALPLPGSYPDLQAAPLLCGGLIGYRAMCMAGDAEHIGLYGFGSAAHIIAQVARFQGRKVYAFTRPGNEAQLRFARSMGVDWAGPSDQPGPVTLDAALVFAPNGALVPRALAAIAPGGSVICAGIHMSDIPSFPFELLWGERSLRSVANLTRRDGIEFMELVPRVAVQTEVTAYPLSQLPLALDDLRASRFSGSAVITL
ncbi:MAG TPA: zinc-dependent alcohol dehydrogenase family protein [Polyangiaceae bacterium]